MVTGSKKVIWLAQGFREYRRAFLVHAGEFLAGEGVDFVAAHTHAPLATNQRGELKDTAPSTPLRAWRWQRNGREVLVSSFPAGWLGADLVVMPESVGYPTGWSVLAARSLRGKRTAIFGHGTDFARPGRDDVAERLSRSRIRHLDWWFAYNAPSVDAVVERGMPHDRVTSVENTLDTSGLVRVAAELTGESRQNLRQELGIGEGPVGLFIGALYRNKRPDVLIEIADAVRRRCPDFSMVIVGDGDEASVVDRAMATRPWLVHLPGDVTDQRARYWAIADVAIYPSAAGLAVNEALALGVPPVIGGGFPHGPEASYVRDGDNGLVVPGTDPEVIAAAILLYLADGGLRERLRARAASDGERLSVGAMAQRFCDGVIRSLERAPRRLERRTP